MEKQDSRPMVIMNDLPSQDMVEEILSGLPAKSLVRYMSVCKPWRTMIPDDPAFKALYSRKASARRCSYLIRTWDSSSRVRFSLLHNGTPLMVEKPVFNPFALRERDRFRIVGSHEGLVCILVLLDLDDFVFRKPSIYFWNPSINKVKPLKRFMYGGIDDVFGFGFSKEKNEHRIVRLIDYFCNRRWSRRRGVYVYSSRPDSWKKIDMVSSGLIRTEFCCIEQPTILDGAPHWLACKGNDPLFVGSSYASMIISFDFDTERFGYIAIPPGAVGRVGSSYDYHNAKVLGTLKGSLAFVYSIRNQELGFTEPEVWVLREYGVESSWTKVFSFQITMVVGLQGLGINGEVFLTSGEKGKKLIEVSDRGMVSRVWQLTSIVGELVPYTERLRKDTN
ncbi:hypothetical protein Tsubulata_029232 [Turnera subulata]|uniref:F-box domain-containing protein n=1 Tax=Turnera subulata TaxID=218843 RepID=A0A9Q0JBW3_9ROSI|nr:hypothetical protein Tsubulata_029232 [Turnera subulata]